MYMYMYMYIYIYTHMTWFVGDKYTASNLDDELDKSFHASYSDFCSETKQIERTLHVIKSVKSNTYQI